MSNGNELRAAKEIERDRLALMRSERLADVTRKTQESERSLAARGLTRSGMAIQQFVDIRVESMKQFITEAVGLRRELIQRTPALASDYELDLLETKLNEHVDGINGAVQAYVTMRKLGREARSRTDGDWPSLCHPA